MKKEPNIGERVLTCDHDASAGLHWISIPSTEIKRSDGETFICAWVCLCNECDRKRVSGTHLDKLVCLDFVLLEKLEWKQNE